MRLQWIDSGLAPSVVTTMVPLTSVAYSARVVLKGDGVLSSLLAPQSIGWLGTAASVAWKLSVIEQRG